MPGAAHGQDRDKQDRKAHEHTEFYHREPLVTHAARAAAAHLRTALEA